MTPPQNDMKSNLVEFYYSDLIHETLRLMREYGVPFEASLSNTYRYADIENRRRIFMNWPELFEKYSPTSFYYSDIWNFAESRRQEES